MQENETTGTTQGNLQPAAASQPAQGNKGKGLGIAAMVLGILAVPPAFIPLINILSFPLAIVGLILGIVAIILAKGGKGPKGFGIAGAILSAVALIVTIAMYASAAAVANDPEVREAIDRVQAAASQAAQSSQSSATTTYGSSTSEKETTEAAFDEATKTFTGKDTTIKIDKTVVGEDYSGKPMLSVYFTITNNGDKDMLVQLLYYDVVGGAYQNNGTTRNKLSMAFTTGGEEDHLQDSLLPGATISGIFDYSLEDSALPVEIEFVDGFFSDDKYILTVQP
ncbi:MAG: DUF5067 domain-containing protein [Coriobacteriales bacterium]|jgi:hypothetical protein|nr:DUF5067 domain-containing protein [Coriobacteriales bacterium]